MKTLKTLLIIYLSIIYVHLNAQDKKGEKVDRVVIGTYSIANDELKEYVVNVQSGEVLYTNDRLGSSVVVGNANRETQKNFQLYVNGYDYSMFMLKYKQSKDYTYVRVYMENGDYQEAYWNESTGPEAQKFYNDVMTFIGTSSQATASK